MIIYGALLSTYAFLVSSANGEEPCEKDQSTSDFNATRWPDLWRISSEYPENPQKSNKQEDGEVEPIVLSNAGVKYRYIDPSGYEYPPKSNGEWVPGDTTADPILKEYRQENNYTFADIITVSKLFPSFWDEHLHAHATIRYILNGSGYFDLRDVDDKWVRMHVKTGDFMEWPAGINHRFTVDEDNFITAMRLFKGSPVWTSYPRAKVLGNNTARNRYVDTYLCGNAPDATVNVTVDVNQSVTSEDVTKSVTSSAFTKGVFFLFTVMPIASSLAIYY